MTDWRKLDAEVLRRITDPEVHFGEKVPFLADYFVEGYRQHKTNAGARVQYPGRKSINGKDADQIEGFSRIAPLLAVQSKVDGTAAGSLSLLRSAISAGVDPSGEEFWGNCEDFDQRVCEAADIALAVWLSRDHLLETMNSHAREHLFDWLREAGQRKVKDNNWLLFSVLIEAVLHQITGEPLAEHGKTRYENFKSNHLGAGWFRDGPDGEVDYYNAWGIHYGLFWINQICPGLDQEFLDKVLTEFVSSFQYFIGPQGFPPYGRSLSYRLAISAPLLAASCISPQTISPGLAMRSLEATWCFFVGKGAISDGNFSPGFFHSDLRAVNAYSGPASGLWGLRSLILAIWLDQRNGFLSVPTEPLPIELADYEIEIPQAGWTVTGKMSDQEICIYQHMAEERKVSPKESLKARLKTVLLGKPSKRNKHLQRYRLPKYSSKPPFFFED